MSRRTARLSLASTLVAVAVAAWVADPVVVSEEDLALQAVAASLEDTVVDPAWVAAPKSSSPTYVHYLHSAMNSQANNLYSFPTTSAGRTSRTSSVKVVGRHKDSRIKFVHR